MFVTCASEILAGPQVLLQRRALRTHDISVDYLAHPGGRLSHSLNFTQDALHTYTYTAKRRENKEKTQH